MHIDAECWSQAPKEIVNILSIVFNSFMYILNPYLSINELNSTNSTNDDDHDDMSMCYCIYMLTCYAMLCYVLAIKN